MIARIFAITVLAASVSLPVANAHAGFWTDVAKGAVKNSARQAKMSASRAAGSASRLGVGAICAAKAAAGRPC